MRITDKLPPLFLVALLGTSACDSEALPPLLDLSLADRSIPSGCSNGLTDGEETDRDCGGPACMPCEVGMACNVGRDCASGICINKMCAAPTCNDTVRNGNETDQDCGGSCPTPCAEGKRCIDGPDCESLICVNGICGKSPCANMQQDGMETDVDCGGPACPRCADMQHCLVDTDCREMCVNNICKSRCTPEVCDRVDNDCNGIVDDLDRGNDGIPDCLRVAMFGDPGNAPVVELPRWLTAGGATFTRTQVDG